MGLESVRRVILINSQRLSINTVVFCSVQPKLCIVFCLEVILAEDSLSINKDLKVGKVMKKHLSMSSKHL